MRFIAYSIAYIYPIFLASTLGICLWAQAPLSPAEPLAEDAVFSGHSSLQWNELMGDAADQLGLPSLAEGFYKNALSQLNSQSAAYDPLVSKNVAHNPLFNKSAAYDPLVLKLSSVLLQGAKYEEARQVLETKAYQPNSSWYLRHAWTGLEEKRWNLIQQDLSCIQKEDLSPSEKPWYYLLKGLCQQAHKQQTQAEHAFNKALASAASDLQRGRIQSLIFKAKIRENTLDAASFEALDREYHNQDPLHRFSPLCLDYALALNQRGREEEAVYVLQTHLAYLAPDDSQNRPQLLLLVAFLKGAETEAGRKALYDLLSLNSPPTLQATALYLLIQANMEDTQPELLQNLVQTLQAQDTGGYPLWEEVGLLRAYTALAKGKLDEAETLSKALIEANPNSRLRANALSLLAYISWQHTPPYYRNAADYLTKLKQETLNPSEQARLDLLIADCFFQNKDYENAAQKYHELLKKTHNTLPRGQIFYQVILSYLEGKKFEEALSVLQLGQTLPDLDPMYRWRASWNYSYKLHTLGKTQEALDYILGMEAKDLPLSLSLRFEWLKAQLYLLDKRPEKALDGVSNLLKVLENLKAHSEGNLKTNSAKSLEAKPEENLKAHSEGNLKTDPAKSLEAKPEENLKPNLESKEDIQADQLAAEAYLLKARAYLKLQKPNEALAVLKHLRNTYPERRAARFAFLEEARLHASSNRLVEALRLCIQLVDSHEKTEEAPIALYEAAHYAELLGQSTNLEQALLFLERLYTDYKSSHLAYYARVKQGDLLRRLNRFESAYLVYKHLLAEYPNHPDAPYIKLLEAKTLLALDPTREDYFQAIVSTCEYLADATKVDLTLRLEAAYTLAFTYVKKNRLAEAEQQYWRLIHYCLQGRAPEASPLSLSRKGQYWLSRGMFDLAELLEKRRAFSEAKTLYQLILDHKLPGLSLAKAKLD